MYIYILVTLKTSRKAEVVTKSDRFANLIRANKNV